MSVRTFDVPNQKPPSIVGKKGNGTLQSRVVQAFKSPDHMSIQPLETTEHSTNRLPTPLHDEIFLSIAHSVARTLVHDDDEAIVSDYLSYDDLLR